jgi:anhydro-N-acetylmuramic acid kinase
MSGTSLDGVDAAVLSTDGERITAFGDSVFCPYSEAQRQLLEQATQAALIWDFEGAHPSIFAAAQDIVHGVHIQAVQSLLAQTELKIDLIGFHGQTLVHRPPHAGQNGQTLQIGDGQVLANALGLDVVFDFRKADMTQGGQGAPLAPVYHKALLVPAQAKLPAAVLNIGGVSNISVVSAEGGLMATDCGPGNGPLDAWVQAHGLGEYDKDGTVSASGIVDDELVNTWLKASFFDKPMPKSADKWDFDVGDDLRGVNAADGAASLCAFSARAIGAALRGYGVNPGNIIVCGGGRKNPTIMRELNRLGLGKFISAEDRGWNGDDLEAQAFAYLAVRHLLGLPISYPHTTGVDAPMGGGVLAKGNLC